MPVFAICALVGVIGGLWVPIFPSAACWPIAMLCSASLAWWVAGVRLVAAIAAFAFASLHGHWYQENLLPGSLVGQDIVVEGVVADLPQVSASSRSFLFRLVPDPSYAAFPQLILLRIYSSDPAPGAGERWELKVRLKRPVSSVNSSGFDYESWLLAKHIHARGYVRNSAINRRKAIIGAHTTVLRFRSRLRDALESQLAAAPVLPLITGISIGSRGGISSATWQILRDSGTGHLVAISGLHIGLIALGCWWPGRLLGWSLHCLGLVACPLAVARICVLLAACAYGSLAGFSVPTIRASVMVGVILLLATMQRQRLASGVLAAALLAVLLLDPLSVLSAGFWLSFVAVALLYTFISQVEVRPDQPTRGLTKIGINLWSAVRHAFNSQILLSLGLALPTLLIFAQVSLIAPLANLVAVPLFTIWILPATLTGVVLTVMQCGFATPLLKFAALGMTWLMAYLERLVTLPAATWRPGDIGWMLIAVLFVGVMAFLMPRPFPGRLAGLTLLFCVLRAEYRPARPPLTLRVLDVGQGLSVLIQTPNHSLLYDAGGAWRDGNAGESIIVPELAAAGLRALDILMVSHDDADHRGGAQSVLQAIPVGRVLASGGQHYPAAKKTQKCRHGMHWQWDGVEFEILHPGDKGFWTENDGSCVLRVRFARSTLLLPGDIEARAEFELMRKFDLEEVDLVLGPHHGSRTSSGAAFVRELSASFVIFSAGYANRWGFPVADVVQRWVDNKACVLTTADSGAIEFVAASGGGFRLVAAARSGLTRPWPVRDATAGQCISTINGADGTV